MAVASNRSVLRQAEGIGHVGNIELFFDLVFVFAVTQESHLLVQRHGADAGVQAAVLLAMVWQLWVYTTWALSYLDPNRGPARAMLIALMLGSLLLAAGIPDAFGDHGWLVAGVYVAMQTGRALFAILVLRGEHLQMVFVRILPWSAVSGAVVLLGAVEHGHVRELLWAAAIVIDTVGAALGFHVPGRGRSATTDWTISGSHFAERCQAFVLIALGESIIVMGGLLPVHHPTGPKIAAFGAAFAGAVGLWWVYFDRAAEDSVRAIERSADPGRLARNAFHWIHPLIIGGIIVAAAADERVLDGPTVRGNAATAWLVLGGTALFLGAHALFKAVVWRRLSWPRLAGVAAAALLGLLAPHVAALTLSICAVAVIVAVAIADRLGRPV